MGSTSKVKLQSRVLQRQDVKWSVAIWLNEHRILSDKKMYGDADSQELNLEDDKMTTHLLSTIISKTYENIQMTIRWTVYDPDMITPCAHGPHKKDDGLILPCDIF